GESTRPVASISLCAPPASPTALMRPLLTSRSPRNPGAPVPSMMVAFRMVRSAGIAPLLVVCPALYRSGRCLRQCDAAALRTRYVRKSPEQETSMAANDGKANRLAHQTSPYLLRDADNTVDWQLCG